MVFEIATKQAGGYLAILFVNFAAFLNSIDAHSATSFTLLLFSFHSLAALFGLHVHFGSTVIDFFLVRMESSSSRISGVRALGYDRHNHELCVTLMHPLQMLFLHSLCVEERVMSWATSPSARSVWLVKVIGRLCDILRALSWLNAADIAAELLGEINFAWLADAWSTLSTLVDVTGLFVVAEARVSLSFFLLLLHLFCHIVGVFNHICLEVSIEVLWDLIEKAGVSGCFMLLILPSFAKFVCTIHFG